MAQKKGWNVGQSSLFIWTKTNFREIRDFFFQIREIRKNKFSRKFLSRKFVHANFSTLRYTFWRRIRG